MASDQASKFAPMVQGRRGIDRFAGTAVPMSVLTNMPSPILLVDAKRQVGYANPQAEDLLQVVAGADLSLTLRHPIVLSAVDTVLCGEKHSPVDITLPVPVPRSFTLDVVTTDPPPGEVGPWALIVLHDITQARRAEQMRADFVANVSHELRSPLAALIGFIETIKGPAKEDPEAQLRFLNIMQREADRMSRLINDLLSLSKVEINEHIAPKTPVVLNAVMRQVLELQAVKAAEKNMTLMLHGDPLDTEVLGEPDELNQVFQNLIDNAIKYGHEGTEVTITIRAVERVSDANRPGVAVTIQDHGPGISADELPRLTERFYRVDKARSRDLGGTGLGLAIVKHIVNRHRGKVTIQSEENRGSSFTVTLPQA